MLLWFAGLSLAAAWLVFRDPALDYRLVMVGVLLPDAIDGIIGGVAGGPHVMHTVLASAVLLGAVMLGTRGRRPARRHLLALPIGTFLHLVLDGAWTRTKLFWWPVLGASFGDERLPSVDRGLANIALELAGAVVLVWFWRRFRLAEPDRRARFVRTGRLGRDLAE